MLFAVQTKYRGRSAQALLVKQRSEFANERVINMTERLKRGLAVQKLKESSGLVYEIIEGIV